MSLTVDEALEELFELKKVTGKLQKLSDLGLGYLTLGEATPSLSGGEAQRLKLASEIGKSQKNSIFIFDEPTTGLHFHDINTLMKSFDQLIGNGHTVVIIEHNLDVIKCADHIIDLGPEGGDQGGNIVVTGTPEEVAQCKESYTARFLAEKLKK
jgi:excinuclease ABC subunit A